MLKSSALVVTLMLCANPTVYAEAPAPVQKSIEVAGKNSAEIERALGAMKSQKETSAMAWLVANMPASDARTVKADLLINNVRLAVATQNKYPWAKDIPAEIFNEYVLPYASLNEKREDWRSAMEKTLPALVKDAKTASEAALILNEKIFPLMKVQYHPSKRPKPDQCPSESMAAGFASCSGLSIMLVDACRTVGVPARIVGTPSWNNGKTDANGNHGGNHTWVQIWDGQWHTLGASEVSKLDDVWFNDNASKAVGSKLPLNQIYAARWSKTGTTFPMVWAMDDDSVPAELVTMDYAGRRPVKIIKSLSPALRIA